MIFNSEILVSVFPLIGVKIKPMKGVAVFWWNLRRDGGGDPLTRHGGCPESLFFNFTNIFFNVIIYVFKVKF